MKMLIALLRLVPGADAARVRRSIALRVAEAWFAAAPYGVLCLALAAMVEGSFDTALLACLCLALLACLALQLVCSIGANVDGFIGGTGMMCELRLRIAAQLRRLPQGFHARRRSGDLASLMAENVVHVEEALTHLAGELCGRLAIAGLTGLLLMALDWRLGLLALGGAGLGGWLFQRMQRRGARLARAKLAQKAETGNSLLEFVQGIKVIRAFGLTAERHGKVLAALQALRRLAIQGEAAAGAAAVGLAVLLDIAWLLGLAGAFQFSLGSHLTQALLLMFLVMSQRFFSILSEAAVLMAQLNFYGKSFERIATLLAEPGLPECAPGSVGAGHDIEFRGVSFSHAAGVPALQEVSFTASPGKVTALVGPSGAGKSTIVQLIARFHDADTGQILIGGVDIRAMRQQDLMAKLAIVQQDTYLFDDTIENNLRLAKPDASDAALRAAAQAACCDEFIARLPDGYRTVVGEGGARLSGGERQRLSIARAILKDAPIVLLDEATASIDAGNESAIRRALAALVQDKTVLVVAHRLHTIASVEQILVLERGRVIERGGHAGLLADGGLYARFWRQQLHARQWRFRPPAAVTAG